MRNISRSGANTSDHVDILGSTILNEIIRRVATGIGHEIEESVVSGVREYAQRIDWDWRYIIFITVCDPRRHKYLLEFTGSHFCRFAAVARRAPQVPDHTRSVTPASSLARMPCVIYNLYGKSIRVLMGCVLMIRTGGRI